MGPVWALCTCRCLTRQVAVTVYPPPLSSHYTRCIKRAASRGNKYEWQFFHPPLRYPSNKLSRADQTEHRILEHGSLLRVESSITRHKNSPSVGQECVTAVHEMANIALELMIRERE